MKQVLLVSCLIVVLFPFVGWCGPFSDGIVQLSHQAADHDAGEHVLPAVKATSPGFHMRLATYNIAHARGSESGGFRQELAKMKNLRGIVELVKKERLDVIGFTEISSRDLRAGFRDQPKYIANKLGYHYVYEENVEKLKGLLASQGNAVVSRFPILSSKNHKLWKADAKNEQRGCLETVLDLGKGRRLRFLVCHLSTKAEESEVQMEEIWELIADSKDPVVLVGDFNSRPQHARTKLLATRMKDTTAAIDTTYKNKPGVKIDYHFLLGQLNYGQASVKGFKEGYSDHGCLSNDYWWPDPIVLPAVPGGK